MAKLFIEPLPCLSKSRIYYRDEIYEQFFEKKTDKRHVESDFLKFIEFNKHSFEFLGINVITEGTGNDFRIHFETSQYIGAIPLRMPYNGKFLQDFQVIPRFDNDANALAELTHLLGILDHSVIPEYLSGAKLTLPYNLRPPMYYEAAKYIDLFCKVISYRWQKFDTQKQHHSYPKAGTDWSEYSKSSYDPKNALRFPTHDNVLSQNHCEFQKLKYVFSIAKDILLESSVPANIRIRLIPIIKSVEEKTKNIPAIKCDTISLLRNEPVCVKEAKEQANLLLNKNSSNCLAWRIDVSTLFERYVQHIFNDLVKEVTGKSYNNNKFSGRGRIPHWGLSYIEPDIVLSINEKLIVADAKYKAHYYARSVSSAI